MTLDNMTGITEGSYTGFCKRQLITCNFVKACNGVCPFEDALKHADKTQTMNEQHAVDHDRDWIPREHFDVLKKNYDMLAGLLKEAKARSIGAWIPFTRRPLTDEEKQEYPDWTYIFDCPLPDDEEEILLSNGKYVWTDTFINDGECYLDGGDDIDDGMAWMPLPKPYREDGKHE